MFDIDEMKICIFVSKYFPKVFEFVKYFQILFTDTKLSAKKTNVYTRPKCIARNNATVENFSVVLSVGKASWGGAVDGSI